MIDTQKPLDPLTNQNRVYWNKKTNIVEIDVVGDQSYEKMLKLAKQSQKYKKLIEKDGNDFVVLGNISLMGALEPKAMTVVTEYMTINKYKKAAIYGKMSILQRNFANVVAKLGGSETTTRFLGTEEEAKKWLLQKD